MNKMNKVFVTAALELSDNEHSKLSEREKELFGLSSIRLRAFINNVCSKENIKYLEIGVYRGATLLSALYGNKTTKAVGIDNFSYDDREPNKYAPKGHIWDNMKSQLEANIERYKDPNAGVDTNNVTIIQNSFQDVVWEKGTTFDVCFFDVTPVNEEVYQQFFDKILPVMSQESILIFSNYSNSQHAEQLDSVIAKNNNKMQVLLKEQRVSAGLSDSTKYYSGILVLYVKKSTNKVVNE
jgi:hypothetical protein